MTQTDTWPEPEVLSRLKDSSLLDERRQQLVAAATEVFFERGYDRASVNEIAERCGWSVGGLYRYVRKKEDILVLVCTEIFRRIGPASLTAPDSLCPRERLRDALTAYCENIQQHARQVLLLYREYGRLSPDTRRYFMQLETRVRTVFQRLVEDGIADGAFTCEDPELFAVDCIGRTHTLALKGWALGNRSPEQTIDALVSWTLRSLTRATTE